MKSVAMLTFEQVEKTAVLEDGIVSFPQLGIFGLMSIAHSQYLHHIRQVVDNDPAFKQVRDDVLLNLASCRWYRMENNVPTVVRVSVGKEILVFIEKGNEDRPFCEGYGMVLESLTSKVLFYGPMERCEVLYWYLTSNDLGAFTELPEWWEGSKESEVKTSEKLSLVQVVGKEFLT